MSVSEEATPPTPPPPPPPTSASAFATSEVLFREYGLIWGEDEETRDPEVYCRKANSRGQAALCLSGGGIRSAAFALGAIQSLARRQLLHRFDYLSTVSGGGYIGSWLMSWVQRRGYEAVLAGLRSDREPDRTSPLAYLWRYSNYLTPHTGLFSADEVNVTATTTRSRTPWSSSWSTIEPAPDRWIASRMIAARSASVIVRGTTSGGSSGGGARRTRPSRAATSVSGSSGAASAGRAPASAAADATDASRRNSPTATSAATRAFRGISTRTHPRSS